ncbi:hypothetical protein P3T37_004663 [Kitasatospora sp. MAA4]|uniref:hypothetical protein n=1 Tax=Kitasatospora sp. MAA4 TaxID=3035093 RepID=UPI00247378C8|nr:hypothetical protein [Kitasatospora sp. MAA4]MDH6135253.1 hypothetical protein [Kitasatospora sp. MAA4]
MRSGLVQTGAWAAATGVAVLLSWLGVSSVLSDDAFGPPKPLPLPATSAAPGPAAAPSPSASPSPSTMPPPAPTHQSPTPTPESSEDGNDDDSADGGDSADPTPSAVHSYLVPGGRVALDIHPDSAELVSATPDAGWQMQVWHGDEWMRIDFSLNNATNSVFVTWNGHAPDVQTVVR